MQPDACHSTRFSAYTPAMFSETRYALNGDLRVAYRTSREGPRDIVFLPNWFTCCEVLPELKTTKDPFGDIDGVITVVFHDGTPEKMFNDTDEVEFATIRPPWV